MYKFIDKETRLKCKQILKDLACELKVLYMTQYIVNIYVAVAEWFSAGLWPRQRGFNSRRSPWLHKY